MRVVQMDHLQSAYGSLSSNSSQATTGSQVQKLEPAGFNMSTNAKPLFCCYCYSQEDNADAIEEHKETFHRFCRFGCGICSVSKFDTIEEIRQHLRTDHSMQSTESHENEDSVTILPTTKERVTHFCPWCSRGFHGFTSSDVNAHFSTVHGSRFVPKNLKILCRICGDGFQSSEEVLDHISTAHPWGNYWEDFIVPNPSSENIKPMIADLDADIGQINQDIGQNNQNIGQNNQDIVASDHEIGAIISDEESGEILRNATSDDSLVILPPFEKHVNVLSVVEISSSDELQPKKTTKKLKKKKSTDSKVSKKSKDRKTLKKRKDTSSSSSSDEDDSDSDARDIRLFNAKKAKLLSQKEESSRKTSKRKITLKDERRSLDKNESDKASKKRERSRSSSKISKKPKVRRSSSKSYSDSDNPKVAKKKSKAGSASAEKEAKTKKPKEAKRSSKSASLEASSKSKTRRTSQSSDSSNGDKSKPRKGTRERSLSCVSSTSKASKGSSTRRSRTSRGHLGHRFRPHSPSRFESTDRSSSRSSRSRERSRDRRRRRSSRRRSSRHQSSRRRSPSRRRSATPRHDRSRSPRSPYNQSEVECHFCDSCNMPVQRGKLRDHLNSILHREKIMGKLRCLFCSSYVDNIKEHMLQNHEDQTFACKVKKCLDKTKHLTIDGIKKHVNTEHPQEVWDRINQLNKNLTSLPQCLSVSSCSFCNKIFVAKSLTYVFQHMATACGVKRPSVRDIVIWCRICGPEKLYDTMSMFQQHTLLHLDKSGRTSDKPVWNNNTQPKISTTKQHNCTQEKACFHCVGCSFHSDNIPDRFDHQVSNHPQLRYACYKCPRFTSLNRSTINDHLKKFHSIEEEDFDLHIVPPKDPREIACKNCNETDNLRVGTWLGRKLRDVSLELRGHIKFYHQSNSFIPDAFEFRCRICPKKIFPISEESKWKEHMKAHSERPQTTLAPMCNYCTKKETPEHLMVHLQETFHCKKCLVSKPTNSFHTFPEAFNHFEKHHDKKSDSPSKHFFIPKQLQCLKCKYCDHFLHAQTFDNFQEHFKLFHPSVRNPSIHLEYLCRMCMKPFDTNDELTKHIHSGIHKDVVSEIEETPPGSDQLVPDNIPLPSSTSASTPGVSTATPGVPAAISGVPAAISGVPASTSVFLAKTPSSSTTPLRVSTPTSGLSATTSAAKTGSKLVNGSAQGPKQMPMIGPMPGAKSKICFTLKPIASTGRIASSTLAEPTAWQIVEPTMQNIIDKII